MLISSFIYLAIGALAGSFVNGLAGFGTAIVALSIWLHVFDPLTAASLAVVCAVVGHVQAVMRKGRAIMNLRAIPLVLGGLIGIPFGAQLLVHMDPDVVRQGVGFFLIIYALICLSGGLQRGVFKSNYATDGAVGLVSGFLGGFAGMSGILPTLWGTVLGWSKVEQRTIYQTFNFAILTATLVTYAASGVFDRERLILSLASIPFALVGTGVGLILYEYINEQQFQKAILVLLMFSGVTLISPSLYALF